MPFSFQPFSRVLRLPLMVLAWSDWGTFNLLLENWSGLQVQGGLQYLAVDRMLARWN